MVVNKLGCPTGLVDTTGGVGVCVFCGKVDDETAVKIVSLVPPSKVVDVVDFVPSSSNDPLTLSVAGDPLVVVVVIVVIVVVNKLSPAGRMSTLDAII